MEAPKQDQEQDQGKRGGRSIQTLLEAERAYRMYGSYSKAGNALGIPQTTVYNRVCRLESMRETKMDREAEARECLRQFRNHRAANFHVLQQATPEHFAEYVNGVLSGEVQYLTILR